MSGHNAERTLPPGDRDEPSLPLASSGHHDAGQETAEAAGGGLLPGLTLELDRIGQLLDEAQMVLGDIKLGRGQASWPILESAAHRLAVLAPHVKHTVTAARARRSPQAAAARQAAE